VQGVPWVLALLTGEGDIEDVRGMSREEVQAGVNEGVSIALEAHRKAILRLAREVDDLKSGGD
jgi:hypothetical protein